jgi:hypothetical protein
MNNKEKAEEILDCVNCKKQLFIGAVKCPPTCADFNDLMEMAQWKYEQFDEEKKELLGLVNMLSVDKHNQTIIDDLKALLQ